jgi:hypothetical protein
MNSDLESSFHGAMLRIYQLALINCHYRATYFYQMVISYGGLQTAKMLLNKPGFQYGFGILWEKGRLDLSMEALVLKAPWTILFTCDELKIAQERLVKCGYNPN